MKKIIMITTALMVIAAPAPAFAGNKGEGGLGQAIENIIDSVVDVFTGDEDDKEKNSAGEGGNENALNQIDKNIDKHGGSHHGLENARRAVSKQKDVNDADGDGDTEELIDVIVEEIGEGVKEELDLTDGSADKFSDGHPGKGNGHKGKGHHKD